MGKSVANGNGSKHSLDDDDDDDEQRFYIPAKTWQGPKRGYYFGTTAELGTGYYLDSQAASDTTAAVGNEPPKKKAKRSGGFAEERNETALIVESSALLLAQAEQNQSSSTTKIVALTAAGVKAAAASLQKAAEQNALQRAKEESSQSTAIQAAEQYMESEIALYENIAALKAFAAEPATLYPVLIQQQVLQQLVQLLLHENVDIAIAVVSVLLEWLDTTDLISEESDKRQDAIHQMATALLASEGPELLVENLARMQQSTNDVNDDKNDEDEDDDVGRGVEDILSLLENLLELDLSSETDDESSNGGSKSVAASLCKDTAIVSWLFQQIQQYDKNDTTLRNRSMELLAYLTPRDEIYSAISDWSCLPAYSSTFTADNNKKKAPALDGIEILLQSVAAFRKKQPANDTEVEFLENAAMVLASILTYSPKAVETFLEAQGIQLVMRCLKERVYAGAVALKWLDFAGSSTNDSTLHRHACEELVQAGALKHIFPLLLGRHLPKFHTQTTTTSQQKKDKKEFQHQLEGTAVRILYALVRHLRDDSPHDAKERLLAKFLSDNESNEKINRLVELLLSYDQRARLAEYKFYRSDVEETIVDGTDDDDKDAIVQLAALDAKLAAGGDILHRLAAIAAFCCVGSKTCHQQILTQLHAQQSGIGLIREVLEEFVSVLGDSEQKQQLQTYLEQI